MCGPLWASPLQFLSVESWQVEARWPEEKRQDHTHSQCAGLVAFMVKGVSLGSWQVQTHHKASMQAFGFSQRFLLQQHSGTQQTVPPAAVSATAQCYTREHICISFSAYCVPLAVQGSINIKNNAVQGNSFVYIFNRINEPCSRLMTCPG